MAKLKVRVLAEYFGSPREPTARRGDVIEIEREDFERYPGTFEDIEATERARMEVAQPVQDPWFMAQKEALRAERESAAAARAITTERQAEAVKVRAEQFKAIAMESQPAKKAK